MWFVATCLNHIPTLLAKCKRMTAMKHIKWNYSLLPEDEKMQMHSNNFTFNKFTHERFNEYFSYRLYLDVSQTFAQTQEKLLQLHFTQSHFKFLKKPYTLLLAHCVWSFFFTVKSTVWLREKGKTREKYIMKKLALIMQHPMDRKVIFISSKFNVEREFLMLFFWHFLDWIAFAMNEQK